MMQALLPTPLKILSVTPGGQLRIPDESSVAQACPVALSEASMARIAEWRAEFSDTRPADGGDSEPAIGGSSAAVVPIPGAAAAQETEKSGTEVTAGQKVSKIEDVGDTVLRSTVLSSMASANAFKETRLVLSRTKDGSLRVWLHNTANKVMSIAVGTVLGHGGPGKFVSLVQQSLEPGMEPFAWRWTRITNHKRDSVDLGGAMIFQKDGAGQTLSAPPVLKTMEAIEKELGNNVTLYGHSITRPTGTTAKVTIVPAATPVVWCPARTEAELVVDRFCSNVLGQFIPSREIPHTSNQTKSTGLVRTVFTVAASDRASGSAGLTGDVSGTAWSLQPLSTPESVHFILTKKLEIQAGEFVAF